MSLDKGKSLCKGPAAGKQTTNKQKNPTTSTNQNTRECPRDLEAASVPGAYGVRGIGGQDKVERKVKASHAGPCRKGMWIS